MFDAVARRSAWPVVAVTLGLLGVAVWAVPDRTERASVLAGGGDPLASPFAEERRDQPYPESPLAVSLALEAGLAAVDVDAALAFGDALARELGFWLLATTGAGDLDEAERRLWSVEGSPDRLAVAWAVRLQQREVYARTSLPGLWAGVPAAGPRYVHPDELPLLFAHVAWRLDLDAELVRSPIHLYVLLHDPGGDGVRGLEPTSFRRVDVLGANVPSEEASVGRRLTFGADFFSSGVGGLRNPDPLPAGAYTPVAPSELVGELLGRAAARHDTDPATLEARLADQPALAPVVWRMRLAAGIAAWEDGDLDRVRVAAERLAALRRDHGGALPPAPDELVLEAVGQLAAGDAEEGLRRVRGVLSAYEPDGPVLFAKSDAHAVAMWLDLEHGRATPEDWNRRVIPLMNRHRDDPERFAALCAIGRRVLAETHDDLEVLIPECRGR
jgi:hypothetical protein